MNIRLDMSSLIFVSRLIIMEVVCISKYIIDIILCKKVDFSRGIVYFLCFLCNKHHIVLTSVCVLCKDKKDHHNKIYHTKVIKISTYRYACFCKMSIRYKKTVKKEFLALYRATIVKRCSFFIFKYLNIFCIKSICI